MSIIKTDRHWGTQTQLALKHFAIGSEMMPLEIIHAFGIIKMAAAVTNQTCGKLSKPKAELIINASKEIIDGKLDTHFPLSIWQSGSGTQTNMNCNEVIANLAGNDIHPNDDVNMSQSTNDTFPTAIHIAATKLIIRRLLPAILGLRDALTKKQKEFSKIVKIGRTHLQDAVPLTLGQEFSGYVAQLNTSLKNINNILPQLQQLAIGGTAVGTGLNAPKNFGKLAAQGISKLTNIKFVSATNKFAALAAHDAAVMMSGALKTLATALMKIANDIRWLSSGPRCGIGELILPANEPGSSIMPGKINPTQCEAMSMACIQVMGNDTAISFAGSQGNFELNAFKPLIAYNLLQSITILSDACTSFTKHTIVNLQTNRTKIKHFLDSSLMLITALTPQIGYDKATEIANKASIEGITLRQACLALGYLTAKQFDALVKPENMI